MAGSYFHTALAYAKGIMACNLPKEKLERVVSEVVTISEHEVSNLKISDFSKIPLEKETLNLLTILFSQGKQFLIPQIAKFLKSFFFDSIGVKIAEIRTSETLTQAEEAKIKEELKSFFKIEIYLEQKIDKTLINGFRMIIDSFLLDFSTKEKILKIKSCILK